MAVAALAEVAGEGPIRDAGATGFFGTEDEYAARKPEGTCSGRRSKPAEVASKTLASEERGGADSTPDD